jgi:FkbM family methyltransferase
MTARSEGCVVETTVSGKLIRFFVANRADMIQTYHYHAQFYEVEELGIISKFFRPEGAFIDVGANVGNHAIYVSKFLEPRSILVFEPNPAAISILRINLALNGCLNVDTRFLGVALGAASGRVRLEERDCNNLGSARFIPDETGNFLTITGDSVLTREAPTFIKIDIEGMEMEVLAGLAETIRSWRPNIFIEIQACNPAQFNSWCNAVHYNVVGQHKRYEDIVNFMIVPA